MRQKTMSYKLFFILVLLHVAVGREVRGPSQRKLERFRGVSLKAVPPEVFTSCLLRCQKRDRCQIGTRQSGRFSSQDKCYRCIERCWLDKTYVSPKSIEV
ncbi:unnamed protein product [Cylicocyclus nassatus]|uniref:Uncharacterized protein n=1 Tax=Cylicocyclus nassatus TaxID=53992 RepID=A0AA36GEW6_CYLNA|nr:unnamed protein product [Cylicocyclus nassatus]